MSHETTTKASFPLACAAIRQRRFRVEFVGTSSIRGKHQRFVVLASGTVVFECDGGGSALRWLQDKEHTRIHEASERRLSLVAARR